MKKSDLLRLIAGNKFREFTQVDYNTYEGGIVQLGKEKMLISELKSGVIIIDNVGAEFIGENESDNIRIDLY